MSSKSVTILLEKKEKKEKKLKNVLKQLNGPSEKKSKAEKFPQKALRPFWGNKLENVLKKHYGPSRKKVKN